MAKYDINIRDYWRIIRKRRTIVILSAVFFTIASFLFSLVSAPEPLYTATSGVKVEQAMDLTTLLLGTVSWTSWDNVSTQAVIITSFPVFEESARQMGLIPENVSSAQVRSTKEYLQVVTALKSKITTEQEGNTNIINITATTSNGTEAALLANTVAEVYRQNNINERNKKVRETREFIEKQLLVVESRLQQAEKSLRNYEKSTKLVALDAQTTAVIERFISLENEVANLQQKRLEAKRQLGLLQEFLEGKQSVSQEAFYVEDPSPQLAKLTARFRDLSLRREVLLNDYTEEHPEVDSVDAELFNVLSEMDKELRSMLATMESRLQDLEKRLEAARDQAMAIPDSVLVLARLRREVEVNGDLLAQLKRKYQEVMIQESGLIEEVKVIKPALEPSHPINRPNTLLNTVTGGIIGLVVGLVLALIVETMDTSLGTIEDVEEILGIPVLGVIPSIEEFGVDEKGENGAKKRVGPLVTHFSPRSPVSEAYRSLRTNLQFIRSDKEAKTYLITSSSLQEGKTYNVVNLSLSLAQAGEKVLLIDADLRRPTVHRIFGLQRQPGLTDYIVGTGELEPKPENTVEFDMNLKFNSSQADNGWEKVTNTIIDLMLGEFGIDDILKTPGLDNLHVINAGQGLLNPSEILRSPRFKEFLREVREHYDIIIVDTPPVLPVVDAFEVAREVDGVILVYEVGRIGRGILNRAKVQLENMNSNVLGVILNNVKPDVAPDFYRYRTDYYYRAEGDEETEPTPTRWWDFLDKGFQGIFSKLRLSATAEGRRFSVFTLILLVGILAFAGLAWQNYPILKSAYQRWLGPQQEEASPASSMIQKKETLSAVSAPVEREQPDLLASPPTIESKRVAPVVNAQKAQMAGEKGNKTERSPKAPSPMAEQTKPISKDTDKQVAMVTQPPADTTVKRTPAVSQTEPEKSQIQPTEASVGDFLEKWRHSWEEGDVQTYVGCYHSGFTARGMDIQAWKNYKQDVFNRTVEREVQLSDISIKLDGSIARVTFKQRYQTKNYKGYGLKTLQLTNYQGNWAILEESYESLPPEVKPVDVAIQRFVENWRRAWEEGDLQTYTNCYHPDFKTEKMTTQEWKDYKQVLFSSAAKRKVQIDDIQIQENGSSAVVTFKQRYLTAKHQDVGLKTLQLRRYDDRWTILKETWRSLSGQG